MMLAIRIEARNSRDSIADDLWRLDPQLGTISGFAKNVSYKSRICR